MRMAAAAVVLTLFCSTARADDREWYGWQPMIGDGLFVGLVAATWQPAKNHPNYRLLPLAVYLFASPTIHLMHEEDLAGLESLGARASFPIVLGTVGFVAGHSLTQKLGGLLIGGGLGMLGAMALDYAVLSYHPKDPRPVMLSIGGRF